MCFGHVIFVCSVLVSGSALLSWGYFDVSGAPHAFERWADSNDEDCFAAHITAYYPAPALSPSSFGSADGLEEVPEGGSDRGRGRWSWLCCLRVSP